MDDSHWTRSGIRLKRSAKSESYPILARPGALISQVAHTAPLLLQKQVGQPLFLCVFGQSFIAFFYPACALCSRVCNTFRVQPGASFGKTSEPDHPPYRAVALVSTDIPSNRAKSAAATSTATRGPPLTPSFKSSASLPPREPGGWIAGEEGAIPAAAPAIALTAPPDVGFDPSTITQYDEQIKQHKLREAISHGRVLAKMQQQLDHFPLSFLFNYRNDDNYKLYVQNRSLDVMERMYTKLNAGSLRVRAFFACWQQKVQVYL